jgi:hypothetical protein
LLLLLLPLLLGWVALSQLRLEYRTCLVLVLH